MSRGTVYVPHSDGRFDLSDARRFGELKVLFTKELFPDDAAERMPNVLREAYGQLGDFDPGTDYLVLVGAPVYSALCTYVLGDMGKTPVRMLRFDREAQGYYEIKIS